MQTNNNDNCIIVGRFDAFTFSAGECRAKAPEPTFYFTVAGEVHTIFLQCFHHHGVALTFTPVCPNNPRHSWNTVLANIQQRRTIFIMQQRCVLWREPLKPLLLKLCPKLASSINSNRLCWFWSNPIFHLLGIWNLNLENCELSCFNSTTLINFISPSYLLAIKLTV